MIRVLVVDDHPVLRAGLEAVLRTQPGFVCVGVAATEHETIRAVRHTRPDVVVLDRRLGVEDGIEICATLRAEPGPPQVLIYTADPAEVLRDRALAAGACDVIEKTIDVETLFDAVRLAARRSTAAA